MAEATTPPNDADVSAWVREHFQKANKYLAEQGIIVDRVLTKRCRYLVPLVAVWRLTTQDKKEIWAINGDVPSDVVSAKVAETARDALKHFALQWQLRAEGIVQDPEASKDPEQQRYASFLVGRAESLYEMTEQDDLWKDEPVS
ncbi:DUF4826 domain-containing protein [Pseudidiomarina aestuarii]|uniref:DUF4826 domain-containing protein n=1 Tax=Pseudidiomarina aestuarii TaxID=624146 RepID=A0A7Z6ZU51_9GAMM|nr:DUF4826 family protein [Pseudidiomarina aestuarii]RUO41115.1 DUF4826 domain-containing protein [Pseudidiomarina aestuarii]